MKRLLLTLSLICYSWGAGANSIFRVDEHFQVEKGVPTQVCFEAKKNGIHLKSNYYFYEGFIYELIIHINGSHIMLNCHLFSKNE